MSQKQFAVLCGLLAAVILLQAALLRQNRGLAENFANVSGYLSEKIDALTGKVNMLDNR